MLETESALLDEQNLLQFLDRSVMRGITVRSGSRLYPLSDDVQCANVGLGQV